MTVVKICGVRLLEDALAAAEAGADMIGLNFYRKSPRSLTPADAAQLVTELRAGLGDRCPLLIGVFVNESVYEMGTIAAGVGLDAIQLSGDESLEVMNELRVPSYKGVQPANLAQILDDVHYFMPAMLDDPLLPSLLLDAHHPTLRGGTGQGVAEEIINAVMERVPRLLLAGGLTLDNVGDYVQAFQPWGVDVASGVESGTPGLKDHQKMREFVARARQ